MSTVEETMSRAVLRVRPEDTLEQGAQAMIERRTGSAVVTKGSNLVGIVTERDVLRAVANGRVPWSTKISDVLGMSDSGPGRTFSSVAIICSRY